jgi:UDP-N-acetylglucosamine:LPS N-acetylglucosamine transferase
MKKVLILFAKAGGGHESAAKAIKSELLKCDPEIQVKIYDILEEKSKFKQKFFSLSYIFLIEKFRIGWIIFTFCLRFLPFQWLSYNILKYEIYKPLKKLLFKFEPDIIISTYYFTSGICESIIHKKSQQSYFFTAVTDIFTPHSVWFYNSKDNFFLFSNEAREKALENDVDGNNIIQFNNFFDGKFNQVISPENLQKIRIDLNCKRESKKILILGGAFGLKNSDVLLKQYLDEKIENSEIIIICGKNNQLYKKCFKIKSLYKFNENVKILGFTDKVYEIINLSDVVITKGGPGTVMEIVSQKKLCAINDYIWDQELGNVNFVLQNKLGFYEPNPAKMIKEISNIINNNGFKNYRKLTISSDIIKFAEWIKKELKTKNVGYKAINKYF